MYLFEIFLYRARSPFHIDLYLGHLYCLDCLEFNLLVLAIHFLIVMHCHLMLDLLVGIQDYLLLISNVLPKWTPVRLLKNTAD